MRQLAILDHLGSQQPEGLADYLTGGQLERLSSGTWAACLTSTRACESSLEEEGKEASLHLWRLPSWHANMSRAKVLHGCRFILHSSEFPEGVCVYHCKEIKNLFQSCWKYFGCHSDIICIWPGMSWISGIWSMTTNVIMLSGHMSYISMVCWWSVITKWFQLVSWNE